MKRALLTLAMALGLSAPAFADQALAIANNCMACHNIHKKVVGPAFKDIARKYAHDKEATAQLAIKIVQGSSGVWGPVPMPANQRVSAADAHKLAAWVLTLK